MKEQPAPDEEKPRQYADPIDEDALDDQIALAIASEEEAYAEVLANDPPKFDLSKGQGMPYTLNDPIVRKQSPT